MSERYKTVESVNAVLIVLEHRLMLIIDQEISIFYVEHLVSLHNLDKVLRRI